MQVGLRVGCCEIVLDSRDGQRGTPGVRMDAVIWGALFVLEKSYRAVRDKTKKRMYSAINTATTSVFPIMKHLTCSRRGEVLYTSDLWNPFKILERKYYHDHSLTQREVRLTELSSLLALGQGLDCKPSALPALRPAHMRASRTEVG